VAEFINGKIIVSRLYLQVLHLWVQPTLGLKYSEKVKHWWLTLTIILAAYEAKMGRMAV
jgi:hypothetical protein